MTRRGLLAAFVPAFLQAGDDKNNDVSPDDKPFREFEVVWNDMARARETFTRNYNHMALTPGTVAQGLWAAWSEVERLTPELMTRGRKIMRKLSTVTSGPSLEG